MIEFTDTTGSPVLVNPATVVRVVGSHPSSVKKTTRIVDAGGETVVHAAYADVLKALGIAVSAKKVLSAEDKAKFDAANKAAVDATAAWKALQATANADPTNADKAKAAKGAQGRADKAQIDAVNLAKQLGVPKGF